MPQLKGSQTEKNLLIAFAGESQARNRYTYYASVAKKEGYRQISEAFEETAEQEKEHAKRLFKFLEGGEIKIESSFPAGKIEKTLDNLLKSAEGENHEHSIMYPEFSRIAKEEGFDKISQAFASIAIAEKQHEKRFLGFANNIKNNIVFKKKEKVMWRCLNCGYIHHSAEAPEECPACAHSQGHFEVLAENW
jgi:rubrerythrin